MEDDIRTPDKSFKDRLVSDYEEQFIDNEFMDIDPDLNDAIVQSRIEYEEKLIQEQINNHRRQLFNKLEIQLNYMLLQNDDYTNFFVECLKHEYNKYLDGKCIYIFLFKSHYHYLKKFLDELYIMPKKRNRNSKIDEDLYTLINEKLKNY